jgi:hypothetical protein
MGIFPDVVGTQPAIGRGRARGGCGSGAACGRDAREAVKALIIANQFLDLSGSATVDINLSGFPRGTRAVAQAEGLFREVKLNRGRPMATASQDS